MPFPIPSRLAVWFPGIVVLSIAGAIPGYGAETSDLPAYRTPARDAAQEADAFAQSQTNVLAALERGDAAAAIEHAAGWYRVFRDARERFAAQTPADHPATFAQALHAKGDVLWVADRPGSAVVAWLLEDRLNYPPPVLSDADPDNPSYPDTWMEWRQHVLRELGRVIPAPSSNTAVGFQPALPEWSPVLRHPVDLFDGRRIPQAELVPGWPRAPEMRELDHLLPPRFSLLRVDVMASALDAGITSHLVRPRRLRTTEPVANAAYDRVRADFHQQLEDYRTRLWELQQRVAREVPLVIVATSTERRLVGYERVITTRTVMPFDSSIYEQGTKVVTGSFDRPVYENVEIPRSGPDPNHPLARELARLTAERDAFERAGPPRVAATVPGPVTTFHERAIATPALNLRLAFSGSNVRASEVTLPVPLIVEVAHRSPVATNIEAAQDEALAALDTWLLDPNQAAGHLHRAAALHLLQQRLAPVLGEAVAATEAALVAEFILGQFPDDGPNLDQLRARFAPRPPDFPELYVRLRLEVPVPPTRVGKPLHDVPALATLTSTPPADAQAHAALVRAILDTNAALHAESRLASWGRPLAALVAAADQATDRPRLREAIFDAAGQTVELFGGVIGQADYLLALPEARVAAAHRRTASSHRRHLAALLTAVNEKQVDPKLADTLHFAWPDYARAATKPANDDSLDPARLAERLVAGDDAAAIDLAYAHTFGLGVPVDPDLGHFWQQVAYCLNPHAGVVNAANPEEFLSAMSALGSAVAQGVEASRGLAGDPLPASVVDQLTRAARGGSRWAARELSRRGLPVPDGIAARAPISGPIASLRSWVQTNPDPPIEDMRLAALRQANPSPELFARWRAAVASDTKQLADYRQNSPFVALPALPPPVYEARLHDMRGVYIGAVPSSRVPPGEWKLVYDPAVANEARALHARLTTAGMKISLASGTVPPGVFPGPQLRYSREHATDFGPFLWQVAPEVLEAFSPVGTPPLELQFAAPAKPGTIANGNVWIMAHPSRAREAIALAGKFRAADGDTAYLELLISPRSVTRVGVPGTATFAPDAASPWLAKILARANVGDLPPAETLHLRPDWIPLYPDYVIVLRGRETAPADGVPATDLEKITGDPNQYLRFYPPNAWTPETLTRDTAYFW